MGESPLGHVGKVISEGAPCSGRWPAERKIRRVRAVYQQVRDAGGTEAGARIEQDVAALQLKAEAAIGLKRDLYAPSLLRQCHGTNAAANTEVILCQLDSVGRRERNREG